MRKYKSGTAWALWRWTQTDSEYITRLHIIKTPWFAVCLHFIHKPDPEPWLHDHPVTFLSMFLRGFYIELRQRCDSARRRIDECATAPSFILRHRWFNFVRATTCDRHSIVAVGPGTVTLCFMGPKRREWGFHTREASSGAYGGKLGAAKWVGWKKYNAATYPKL